MGKNINSIKLGDYETIVKVVLKEDVELFGEITGDKNPAHFDEEYASKTIFKKRIAHGMLCGSLFSTIFGSPASTTAIAEKVVPKSIPIILLMLFARPLQPYGWRLPLASFGLAL